MSWQPYTLNALERFEHIIMLDFYPGLPHLAWVQSTAVITTAPVY